MVDALADVFGEKGEDRRSRILFETKKIVAFPSIGALEEGHIIVCPKDHFKSIASFSIKSANEIQYAVNLLGRFMSIRFNRPVLIFEHGNGEHTATPSCSVEHAHLHLLPSVVPLKDMRDELRSVSGGDRREGVFSDMLPTLAGQEYILVASTSGEAIAVTGVDFESQFLRRVYARRSGSTKHWNWKLDRRIQNIKATINNFNEFSP